MALDSEILNDKALDTLFRSARTYSTWTDDEVTDVQIRAIYDLLRMGPTGANCCPARFKFIRSEEAKDKLKPALSEGNVEKTMSAPLTAIIAYDLEFYEHLPKLFPHADAKSWYVGKEKFIEKTAFLNGSLQAAYLMLAARSLGLDCGPMAGFNAKAVKDAFFPDDSVVVNILCNIGYGTQEGLHERGPRLEFDEVCEVL